jgi:hypothetical protein
MPIRSLKEDLVRPEDRMKDAMATYHYRLFQLLQLSYNFS